VQLPIEVRSCRPSGGGWLVGAQATDLSTTARDAVIEYCHVVHPFRRLRSGRGATPLMLPTGAWPEQLPAPKPATRVAREAPALARIA